MKASTLLTNLIKVACLVTATQLVACASVSNGTTSSLKIETMAKDGKEVTGANCELSNDSGTVTVVTPGSAMVHRSSSDLRITCKKDGQPSGSASATSRVTGSMFGNILLGGGIGAIVDHSNGSAYNYPEWMKIIMGDSVIFDHKDSKPNQPTPVHTAEMEAAAKKAAEIESANSKSVLK